MSNNKNYLAHLHAARSAGQPSQEAPDLETAMANIKEYADRLSGVDAKDLQELDGLLEKVDSLSGIFEKYAKLQDKIETLQANAALIESTMGDLADMAETADTDPLPGLTQDQTYAVTVQLIKEFEDDTRLARDLLALSVAQELDVAVPDEVPPFEGLTKEQTVQVYMQVMDEVEGDTELSKRLIYNAGVE